MTCHPLAYRILASLGLSSAIGGCDTGGSCEEFEPQETLVAEGCSAEAYDGQTGESFCHELPLEEGACPALDSSAVKTYAKSLYDANTEDTAAEDIFSGLVCGPMEPMGEPSAAGTAECCYIGLVGEIPEHCPGGRPLLIGGEVRIAATERRSDWAAAIEPWRNDATVATEWLKNAAAEHASVASFARVSLELLALGAPADLVSAAHAAALDEIEHAKLCYGMARRYGAGDLGPAKLALDGALGPVTLRSFVESTLREGCLGETVAAYVAERRAAETRDPESRRVHATIARDEERHAVLAWRCVAWALRIGGADVREVVASFLDELDTTHEQVARPALRLVVQPCAAAVLAA